MHSVLGHKKKAKKNVCAVVEIYFVNFGNCECAVEPGTLLFTTGPSLSFPPHPRQLRFPTLFLLWLCRIILLCEDGTVLHRFHHPLLRE